MLAAAAASSRRAASVAATAIVRRTPLPVSAAQLHPLRQFRQQLSAPRLFSSSAPTSSLPLDKAVPPARPPTTSSSDSNGSSGAESADAGASFSSTGGGGSSGGGSESWQPPTPGTGTTPTRGAMFIGRLLGVMFGLYLGYRIVHFIRRKQAVQESRDAARENERPPGAPEIKETLDYRTTSMSAIFGSMLPPLEEFHRRASDFEDRKAAAAAHLVELARRRKSGPVDAAEAKRAEVEQTRLAAEERNVFAPRLAYLSELYRVRSLELMQRSQFNGERMVEAKKALAAAQAAGNASAVADAERLLALLRDEQADFQRLAQGNQSLSVIAQKYGLRGPSGASRMMQPTTEGGARAN